MLGAVALLVQPHGVVDRARVFQRRLSRLGTRRVSRYQRAAVVAGRSGGPCRRRRDRLADRALRSTPRTPRRARWGAALELRRDRRPLCRVVRAELGVELRARAAGDARPIRSRPRHAAGRGRSAKARDVADERPGRNGARARDAAARSRCVARGLAAGRAARRRHVGSARRGRPSRP